MPCEDQAEVDHYWNTLTADGGEESQCGWLKDKYGLSWQIVPNALTRYLGDKDQAKAQRVMQAMLQMKKIDIAGLDRAYKRQPDPEGEFERRRGNDREHRHRERHHSDGPRGRVTRTFDAPRSLVFDAHTKPELVRRWLLGPPGWSMPVCEIDLRVGGRYRYEWASADQQGFGMGGVFREIEAPERLVSTERFDDGTPGFENGSAGEAIDTMVLTERDGRTEMVLTILSPSKEARDAALATGMTDGMAASYDRLAEVLASLPAQGY